jgi:hypothetical protein
MPVRMAGLIRRTRIRPREWCERSQLRILRDSDHPFSSEAEQHSPVIPITLDLAGPKVIGMGEQ